MLIVAPNRVEEWVGTPLTLVAMLPPGEPQSGAQVLSWTVSDTSVLDIAAKAGTSVTLGLKAAGSAFVVARLGDLADSALVKVKQEGELLARFDFPGNTWSNGAALDPNGRVYLFNQEPGELIALSADLSPRWVGSIKNALITPMVGMDGNIYYSAASQTGAFSPEGAVLWRDSAGNMESATTIDAAGNVYGINYQRQVTRYDPSGRKTVLFITWHPDVRVPPVLLQDSILIFTDRARATFALTTSGALLWVDTLPGVVHEYASPGVAGDGRTLFIPLGTSPYNSGAELLVIDGLTGALVRSVTLPFNVRTVNAGVIVGSDGTIYLQTDVNLVALRPDFSTLWRADSLGYVYAPYETGGPALAAGGTLYVACGTTVCAVRTANGSVRWRARLPTYFGKIGPITIAPDSSIIVTTISRGAPSVAVFKLRGRAPLADAPWPLDGGDIARTRRGRVP